MGKSKLDLNSIYRFCKLLKADSIKAEIDEHIKGCSLNSIERKNGVWNCFFESENDKNIYLKISDDNIGIIKSSNNTFERISIDVSLLLSHRIIEKRPDGIIYSVIFKQFLPSGRFKNELVLTDMTEDRYVFTKTNLEKLMDDFSFDEDTLGKFSLKLRTLEYNEALAITSDFVSRFSTHMNYYGIWTDGRKIKDNIYPTRTYLNSEEVSNIFDVNDGPDKLNRVFDLYRGIINSRNEKDINWINLGFLSQDAYDLKGLKGIAEKEDSIVGKSTISVSDEYINYLKQLFNNKFGYKGDLQLDRDSILTAITYKISGIELVKRQVERKLGISYEEYEKLDIDEQHRLIEQKTGEKVKPDYRLYIDGIPMDEEHIITRDQIDKRMSKLTENGHKKLLRKIFESFNKK